MIPKESKRLAEWTSRLPWSATMRRRRNRSVPSITSTLHLWWARRPLAACRAFLLANPRDEHCPPEFKTTVRELLSPVQLGERGEAGA